jgi:hypothetical protein
MQARMTYGWNSVSPAFQTIADHLTKPAEAEVEEDNDRLPSKAQWSVIAESDTIDGPTWRLKNLAKLIVSGKARIELVK